MRPTESPAYRQALIGSVDAAAPACATGSIDIEAPRDAVWDTLAHVENWPSLRDDISKAVPSGPPATGSGFTWHAGGVPVTSAFALVERATRLTWANTAPGMAMACVYEFDELGPARARIRCEESMDAAAVAPHIDDGVLADNIRTWLEGIKAYVEGAGSE
ncbi:SRPBCC family protein [Solicola gregarius]|uniref:SRPBCC family protein n=1 Tax=Solicola gregarius TaxID=2908642 RepID=A0AA46TK76_9ACTN|nr:SRPBCC family protein [Solicola gregarius]UYM06832.1 SRPBCC family protein [Solicola gregarius]